MSRLTNAQSSYLRSAKDQPVEWYPWGPEPFERARAEGKPILLDIGAVWCHWCHVMDHESYDDPKVAEILNREWICIKVDRDERPDVDARYQRAVQALSGQGGWPLTAFLTPTGEVFHGGTYFPPDGKHGRAGFGTVLNELARRFREDPDAIQRQAAEITKHVTPERSESEPGDPTPEILERATDSIARAFDFRHGGFGTQPKFPHPGACDFVLTRWFDTREPWAWEIVERTLVAMAKGGIRDHLGGGFHRYSVDARWIVPHFEKMAYDNSEIVRSYVHTSDVVESGQAGEVSTAPLFRETVEDTVRWVMDTMSDPAGGYYASQDADVGLEDDGNYFTWTTDEVAAAVSEDEYEVLARSYDVTEAGEMQHDPRRNVLWVKDGPAQIATALDKPQTTIEALITSGRARMLAARRQRPEPFIDRTLYTGWNAMMASAMFEAAAYLGNPKLDEHAVVTLERLFHDAADPDLGDGVPHVFGGTAGGILEDQVQAANAALDALEVTGEPRWLERAERLMTHVLSEYLADNGGLLDTASRPALVGFLEQEIQPVQDSPTPSPNGVAAIVLSRLAEHTGSEEWRRSRDSLLAAFAGGVTQLAVFAATMLRAIDWAVSPACHIVIVGEEAATGELRRTARRTFRPRKVLSWLRSDTDGAHLPPEVRAMLDGSSPKAYVCSGTTCAAPVTTAAELRQTLETFGVRGEVTARLTR